MLETGATLLVHFLPAGGSMPQLQCNDTTQTLPPEHMRGETKNMCHSCNSLHPTCCNHNQNHNHVSIISLFGPSLVSCAKKDVPSQHAVGAGAHLGLLQTHGPHNNVAPIIDPQQAREPASWTNFVKYPTPTAVTMYWKGVKFRKIRARERTVATGHLCWALDHQSSP
jgi:hypothetical protein